MEQTMIEQLAEWLNSEAMAISQQHAEMAEQRLILQGRHEACDFVLQKITQLQAVTEPSTSSEVSEPED